MDEPEIEQKSSSTSYQ